MATILCGETAEHQNEYLSYFYNQIKEEVKMAELIVFHSGNPA
jgi:hypothetical protein